ncbi:MAG: hypothetical protein ACOC9W_02650 [Persicimonas sp.]
MTQQTHSSQANASKTISPPQVVLWVLRVTVAVQCVGAAWAIGLDLSPVAKTLYFNVGLPEAAAVWFDRVVLTLLIASAAAVLGLRTRAVPIAVATWFVLLAAGTWYLGGKPFSDWSLAAHAVRYAAPIALAMLHAPSSDQPTGRRNELVQWLLRVAVALTFLVHGLEALSQHPRFVDFLLVGWEKFFGLRLAESSARSLLIAIGIFDVLVAAGALLSRKWRWILAWMAFWGAVTAASRIVYGGADHGHMTLIRAANAGVPLALFWWFGDRRE